MEVLLSLDILTQPDDVTCGPTCLHAVYRYFGDSMPLDQLIGAIPQLGEGGTLAVLLGCHALKRGYEATILTCNLQVFDPTWFRPGARPLKQALLAQAEVKTSPKLREASRGYLEFLELGGRIDMEDFSGTLFRRYLKKRIPVLTGLSATYLYRSAREYGPQSLPDDIRGEPVGHFVVLCGYDPQTRLARIADPFCSHPFGPGRYYEVSVDHMIRAVMLGILTYDANLLIIQPGKPYRDSSPAIRLRQEGQHADVDLR